MYIFLFFGLVLLLRTCRTNGTKICIVLMFDVYLSIKLKAKKTFIIYKILHFKRRMEKVNLLSKYKTPPPQKRIRIMKRPCYKYKKKQNKKKQTNQNIYNKRIYFHVSKIFTIPYISLFLLRFFFLFTHNRFIHY